MTERIYDLLRSLGLSGDYVGFYYAAYAVKLCAKDITRLQSLSKMVYPAVARDYRVTPASVEHGIRTAAAIAWTEGASLLSVLSREKQMQKPSSARFITILTEYIISR